MSTKKIILTAALLLLPIPAKAILQKLRHSGKPS
ncbi:hypothetical protein BD749_0274 [Pontibacter ramchanderi]|uniref:Uncharacterized protein n=1 Tax=Pontibacter ramchanderi TaxID=1179743 RepID=A0A2N3V142_9BACT|nr:hypothetical protein BD749_0274 [Pontibacter ramchanderi]